MVNVPESSLSVSSAEKWLSPHRYSVYMSAASGDRSGALHLYDWNSAVASACMRDIGHFEVLIRNRYAAELDTATADWTSPGSSLWTKESGISNTREKQRRSNSSSRKALRLAAQRAPAPTAGHVIANLTFGFWTALTRPEREATIWTPLLSKVLPGKPRGHLHDAMVKLNKFRNRLAHWEPVFSTTTGLSARLRQFDQIFREIDADVAMWVGGHSAVPSLLADSPLKMLSIDTSAYLRS